MASVDFMKLHSSAEFKRVVRHCDKTMRMQDCLLLYMIESGSFCLNEM